MNGRGLNEEIKFLFHPVMTSLQEFKLFLKALFPNPNTPAVV